MVDKFTAAREYSRNSVCMGRINLSHAQKANGVTSTQFVISRPGGEDHCPKACSETCSELLRSRMVLTLGSANAISKLGAE